MERQLIDDPNNHEAKPIAGSLSFRDLETIFVVVLAVAPFIFAMVALKWNSTACTLLAMLVGCPIGYIGTQKYKNLYFETFAPIVMRERRRPREMCHEAPQAVFPEEPAPKRTRGEERASQDAVMDAMMADSDWARELLMKSRNSEEARSRQDVR